MTFNNAYKIYTVLHDEREHQQDENETDCLKQISMDDAIIKELAHFLLQSCDHVRKRAAYYLPLRRDLIT